jgi:transcriptional regulator with XRE-family HTH domain
MTNHPLRQWRKANGLTLADLKEATGTSAAMLSCIERGRRQPSLKLAVKLSNATDGAVSVQNFAEPEGAEAAE